MYEHPATAWAPSQAPAVFYFETEGMCIGENNIRRPGDHRERAEGERPGPGPANSDGKPCSGVRGGQKASTDFPQQADARLPTLHGKGKTLFRTLFSPCKF